MKSLIAKWKQADDLGRSEISLEVVCAILCTILVLGVVLSVFTFVWQVHHKMTLHEGCERRGGTWTLVGHNDRDGDEWQCIGKDGRLR